MNSDLENKHHAVGFYIYIEYSEIKELLLMLPMHLLE